VLNGSIGANRQRTNVTCTAPAHPGLVTSKALLDTLSGWTRVDFAAPHDAMITHTRVPTELLRRIG